ETRIRFWAAIPASRNASSNEVNRSRCFPTPLVKKIRFGTMSLPNAVALRQIKFVLENAQSNTMVCKARMNLRPRREKYRLEKKREDRRAPRLPGTKRFL